MRARASGDAMTYEEIGRRLGLSRERVRQIEVVALLKLRARGDELPELPERPQHHLGAHVDDVDVHRREIVRAARTRYQNKHRGGLRHGKRG